MDAEKLYENLCDVESLLNDILCDIINESEGARSPKLLTWLDVEYSAIDTVLTTLRPILDDVKKEMERIE